MTQSDFYPVKITILLFSILYSLLVSYPANTFFAVIWIIHCIICINVRRIKTDQIIMYFLRMTLYFADLILWAILMCNNLFDSIRFDSKTFVSLLVCVFAYAVYYLANKEKYNLIFLNSNLSYKKKHISSSILLIYTTIGSVIGEELFFRYIIISELLNYRLISILISSIFFVFHHYNVPWSKKFKATDYGNQFLFGVILACVFVYSKSLIPSLVLHLLFNSPTILVEIKEIFRKVKGASQTCDSGLDDLPL